MGIPIEKSFVVKAPAAAVWEFLTDPVKVASCLPGAAITGQEDGETWGGTITVKIGPVTAAYRGKLRFERLDRQSGEAEIAASGQETRGKGGADMRMKSRVIERAPGETEVTVTSDVNVVGVLAQFGRGMIQDVSDQMFAKFTEAMRRQLEGAPGGAEAEADGAGLSSGSPGAPGSGPRTPGDGADVGDGGREAPAPSPAAAAGATPAAAATEDVLDVGALGTAALGRAAGRAVRRPGFWIAIGVLVLIVVWLASR